MVDRRAWWTMTQMWTWKSHCCQKISRETRNRQLQWYQLMVSIAPHSTDRHIASRQGLQLGGRHVSKHLTTAGMVAPHTSLTSTSTRYKHARLMMRCYRLCRQRKLQLSPLRRMPGACKLRHTWSVLAVGSARDLQQVQLSVRYPWRIYLNRWVLWWSRTARYAACITQPVSSDPNIPTVGQLSRRGCLFPTLVYISFYF